VGTAIIGGTGVYDPGALEAAGEERVDTPWGEVHLQRGRRAGADLFFLARHGADHSVPPHRVNYRANIWALRELGVERILATAAVGSLNREMEPGAFVAVDQFIDQTRGRPGTFFDDRVVHTDLSEPYCTQMRQALAGAAQEMGIHLLSTGCYICTEGPRFETPAEIRAYRRWGADLVGMTGVPEVVLAREAGICYATVAQVTNYAAGVSPRPLSHQEVVEFMAHSALTMRQLFLAAVDRLAGQPRDCCCAALGGF
jgi:5'-methylthioadenosine phosphorylase